MTPRDFIYWLNGFLELSGTNDLTANQVAIIKSHIDLVMTKVTDGGGIGIPQGFPNYCQKTEPSLIEPYKITC